LEREEKRWHNSIIDAKIVVKVILWERNPKFARVAEVRTLS